VKKGQRQAEGICTKKKRINIPKTLKQGWPELQQKGGSRKKSSKYQNTRSPWRRNEPKSLLPEPVRQLGGERGRVTQLGLGHPLLQKRENGINFTGGGKKGDVNLREQKKRKLKCGGANSNEGPRTGEKKKKKKKGKKNLRKESFPPAAEKKRAVDRASPRIALADAQKNTPSSQGGGPSSPKKGEGRSQHTVSFAVKEGGRSEPRKSP